MDQVHNPSTGCTAGALWTGSERAMNVHRSAAGWALRLAGGHYGWSGRRGGLRGCGFGPHRRAGGNGNGRRREGARGGGGDRCGATKGAEMREGEEQRARCGEAEAGRIL
jgi:hypothetical protein